MAPVGQVSIPIRSSCPSGVGREDGEFLHSEERSDDKVSESQIFLECNLILWWWKVMNSFNAILQWSNASITDVVAMEFK